MPDRNFRHRGSRGEDEGSAPPDDATLVMRIRVGDEAAFAIVVHRYTPDMLRFAYAMVHSSETARDVVQMALFRFWQVRDKLERIGSLRFYLIGLVRRCAIDAYRTNTAHARRQEAMQAEVPMATTSSHEAEVLEAATLEAALQQLPEARRLAVRLRLDSELTHEEIGAVLDISTEAARKLVSRGLQDLKKFWGVSG